MLGQEVFGFHTTQPEELADLELGKRFPPIAIQCQRFKRTPGEIAMRGKGPGDIVGNFERDDHGVRIAPAFECDKAGYHWRWIAPKASLLRLRGTSKRSLQH